MKKRLFFLFLVGLSVGIVSASPFEGIIEYETAGLKKNKSIHSTHYIKSPKMRIETQLDGKTSSVMLMNNETKQGFTLMSEQKMAMPINLDRGKEQINAKKQKDMSFAKTGRTKKILGYEADEWTANTEKHQMEIWIGRAVNVQMYPNWMKDTGFADPSLEKAAKEGGLVLEAISKDANGKEMHRMTIKRIEKKSLSNDLFDVPKDYQVFDMKAMMGLKKRP